MYRIRFAYLLVALAIVSCNTSGVAPSATNVPTATRAVTATAVPPTVTLSPSATATRNPSPTARPTATPTPGPDGVCPVLSSGDATVKADSEYANIYELRHDALNALNKGMSARGLGPLLRNARGKVVGSVVEADLTADGVSEIILATSTTIGGHPYRLGWLAVYECSGGQYLANYYEMGEYMEFVEVADIRDWLGNGDPIVVVEYGWIGDACQRGFQIADYSTREWDWIFADYLNCPAEFEVRDATADSPAMIRLNGIEHDIMGVQPDTEVERTYVVEDGEFVKQTN